MIDTTPEGLSAEELSVVETVRRFSLERLAPAAQEIDETSAFVQRHLPALAELGIMGMNLPERWGGTGLSPLGLLACVEAIAGALPGTRAKRRNAM